MKIPFLCGYKGDGIIWFRILGWGLHFKDTDRRELLFSERYGHTKRLQILNWSIRFLSAKSF